MIWRKTLALRKAEFLEGDSFFFVVLFFCFDFFWFFFFEGDS